MTPKIDITVTLADGTTKTNSITFTDSDGVWPPFFLFSKAGEVIKLQLEELHPGFEADRKRQLDEAVAERHKNFGISKDEAEMEAIAEEGQKLMYEGAKHTRARWK